MNSKDDFSGNMPTPNRMRLVNDLQIAMFFMMSNIDFIYDNSRTFSTYLQKQRLGALLKKHGLKLRQKHTIVPHVRFFVLIRDWKMQHIP